MTTRRPRRSQEEPEAFEGKAHADGVSFGLIGVGAVLFLALASYTASDLPGWVSFSRQVPPNDPTVNIAGPFGAVIAGYGMFWLGGAAFLLPFSLIWLGLARMLMGLRLLKDGTWPGRPLWGFMLFLLSGAVFLGVQTAWFQSWWKDYNILGPGGGIGWFGHAVAARTIGTVAFVILALGGYLVGLMMMTGLRMRTVAIVLQRGLRQIVDRLTGRHQETLVRSYEEQAARLAAEQKKADRERRRLERELAQQRQDAGLPGHVPLDPVGQIDLETLDEEETLDVADDLGMVTATDPLPVAHPEVEIINGSRRQAPTGAPKLSLAEWRRQQRGTPDRDASDAPKRAARDGDGPDYSNYELPPLNLLHWDEAAGDLKLDERALRETQQTIINTLASFQISVSPGPITRGPTISRFEIYPAKGLSVKKIASYEADIARATRAERINLLAPIPGKDTVGIEIANSEKVAVPLRELLEDDIFAKTKAKLPLALGKDVYGNTIVADLAAMPHLLVAGATGSGKSVCINSIIGSLLFQFTPEQLRFIMVDPKVVEMQIYNDLPHLVVPVVTDPKKVIAALRWIVNEMEHRYRLFANEGVRNFESFNNRKRREAPPKAASAMAKVSGKPTAIDPESTPMLPLFEAAENGGTPTRDTIPMAAKVPPPSDDDVLFEDPDFAEDDADSESEAHAGLALHPVALNKDLAPDPITSVWDESELVPADNAAYDARVAESLDEDVIVENEEEEADEDAVPETIPYIVLIIDELADLMQTAPADMEGLIARLAGKARAAGIHMILATQTPRKEVITGVIKANVPSRIAFQVTSGLDSRVILDTQGAEKLVGKGDMLYLPPGTAKMVRVQGAFVTDDEIVQLVAHCRGQAAPAFDREVQRSLGDGPPEMEKISDDDQETLEKCIEVIMQERKASTSLLQRRLRLGYGRAARMMDLLEQRGFIGPGDGAKPREVLVQDDDYGEGEERY
jgi:DNA segregation ATPase FtsK/SpoIIIE, S-DNA-T family